MAKYSTNNLKNRRFRRLWLVGGILLIVGLISAVAVHQTYNQRLKPVSNDQRTQIVTIEPGSGVKQIAANLKDAGLIRSAWALELYVHSKQLTTKFQAGSYALAPNAGTRQIVATMTEGQVSTNLVTILPGRRIDQVRADFINSGFSPAAVDKALDPAQYADLPALSYKPQSVTSLEGLLWPESFQKDASTDPSAIIRQSLELTTQNLTAELQAAFAVQNLSPYQGLIMASIVEQEVSKPSDRAQAAQVFLSRIKQDMMLGSDVTAFYGAIAANREASLTFDSAYNTLLNKGLPPSPISSVSLGSLQAVAKPATTDWLYFVAGDNGTTYFSRTFEEHQALIEQYCFELCGR